MDRRRYRRVPIDLNGRLMLTTRHEMPCRAIDMSPGGLHIAAFANVRPGERIVAYIDEIGRVEGLVARSTRQGFAMTLTATSRKREKLAAALTYHSNRRELAIEDMRAAERTPPRQPCATIVLGDGRSYPARLVDESASGLAATCDAPLSPGMVVLVDGRLCTVVRSSRTEHAFRFAREIGAGADDGAGCSLAV